MRALLLLCAVFFAGCYVCSPSTCADGCCSADGVCIVGPRENTACGLGGGACTNCLAQGQLCTNGQCVSGCGAANCAGCCAGTTCIAVSSQSRSSCGRLGETCSVCRNSCVNGGCQ